VFEQPGMAIRLRDPWEAVDLGFILIRTHWKAVMAVWLTVVIPITALLYILFWNHLWLPPLVIWWLNPALDRIVLHVLAKATFGEVPGFAETLRHLPRLMRHGFFATLSWRRLSPQRSFVLPVWQLEEQPGIGFRKRCDILLRRGRGQAIFLTVVCFLFHAVIFSSFMFGIALLTPTNVDFNLGNAVFGSGSDRIHWLDVLLSVIPIISITLLEPFYVAGGFALYLNRRVELEGWDLEVTFRKIAARVSKALGRGIALLLLLGFLTFPMHLQAAPPKPDPKEALAEVLKQPEFQVKRKEKGLHWKSQPQKENPRDVSISPALMPFLKFLAVLAKWAVIGTAVAALLYVIWRNRQFLTSRLRITSEEELPETLFGMDIRPEALPPGLAQVAARLWAEGRIRAALALLYRGALAQLVHHHRIPLSRGATEGDCLRKAREVLPQPSSDYFGRLTRTWLRVAYADLAPEPGAEALCAEWSAHFRETADEVRP
jgi:hypothetical protein